MSEQVTEIRRTVLLNVPIEKAWESVSTSEGIEAWFMPNTFEPRLGAEFVLHAGPYGDSECKVTEFEPPNRLSFDWGKDWQVTFELKEKEGVTEFTLIHVGWDAEKVTEFGESHTVVRDRMDEGWGFILMKLQKQVEK